MKTFALAIFASVPLLLLGCGTDGTTDPCTDCADDDNPDCGADCEQPEPFEATVVVNLPEEVTTPGDFYVDDELACSGDTSCNTTVGSAGDYDVSFDCPSHLFREKTAEISEDGQTATVTLDDWAAKPCGIYDYVSSDGASGTFDVCVEDNGSIFRMTGISVASEVIGGTFSGESQFDPVEVRNGVISDDLVTIAYDQYWEDELDTSFTLTLRE